MNASTASGPPVQTVSTPEKPKSRGRPRLRTSERKRRRSASQRKYKRRKKDRHCQAHKDRDHLFGRINGLRDHGRRINMPEDIAVSLDLGEATQEYCNRLMAAESEFLPPGQFPLRIPVVEDRSKLRDGSIWDHSTWDTRWRKVPEGANGTPPRTYRPRLTASEKRRRREEKERNDDLAFKEVKKRTWDRRARLEEETLLGVRGVAASHQARLDAARRKQNGASTAHSDLEELRAGWEDVRSEWNREGWRRRTSERRSAEFQDYAAATGKSYAFETLKCT